jgi:L-ribulose-5-phosphate 3-epimerase
MLRRDFLTGLAAAAPLLAKKKEPVRNHIDRSRLSAITDEIATTPADAIAFTQKYGLKWVELRDVPGAKIHYARLPDPELKAAAKEFADNGLKVSFLNTPYFKYGLPGTEPVRRKPETPEARDTRQAKEKADFEKRIEQVRQGIHTAQVLGADKMRVFTFLRVAEPESVYQRVADILGELSKIADQEGVKLLVENEGSCNVATSVELASIMKLLPKSVGMNWDSLNGTAFKENPFPDGYKALPKDRLWNVQAKGKSLLDDKQRLDWAAIFRALESDGYQGEVGLETHYFDGTNLEKSQLSMQEMVRLAEAK